MNTYLILSIAGAAFFSVCLALLLVRFGIPTSLSESYYNLGGKDGKGILFYGMLAVTVFLMLTPMVEAAQFWGFLCGAGLLFVGAAPAFKGDSGIDKIIHPISAAVCGITSFMTLLQVRLWWLDIITIAAAVGLALWTKTAKTCYIFWLEMAAFYGLFAGRIIHFA